MDEHAQRAGRSSRVHAPTWVSEPFQELFDRYIPGWRKDSFMLRYALNISPEDVWNAHQRARRLLLDRVNRETNAEMNEDVLTLGFARRATAYKRADLLIQDIGRLKAIAARAGKFQVVSSAAAEEVCEACRLNHFRPPLVFFKPFKQWLDYG